MKNASSQNSTPTSHNLQKLDRDKHRFPVPVSVSWQQIRNRTVGFKGETLLGVGLLFNGKHLPTSWYQKKIIPVTEEGMDESLSFILSKVWLFCGFFLILLIIESPKVCQQQDNTRTDKRGREDDLHWEEEGRRLTLKVTLACAHLTTFNP